MKNSNSSDGLISQAMLQMRKLDIAGLQHAYEGK